MAAGIRGPKKRGQSPRRGHFDHDHQPDSALDIVKTGLIDAVQVIYNIFDQSPETICSRSHSG